MAGKSDFQSDAVLNAARGTALAAWTPYAALFSSAPSDAAGGTELSGSGYARQAVTFSAPTAAAPSGRSIANSGTVTFGPATGTAWTNATHFGVYDALTGGNYRGGAALDTPKAVGIGESAAYAPGALVWVED